VPPSVEVGAGVVGSTDVGSAVGASADVGSVVVWTTEVGSPVGCKIDEGSPVDAEASVTVGVALGATVCSASVDVVGVDWSTEPVGDDEEP